MSTPPSDVSPIHDLFARVRRQTHEFEWTAKRIAGLYFFLGMGFLFVSDVVFVLFLSDPLLSQIQAVKGAVEVSLTAGFIYLLTRQSRKHLQQENSELRRTTNLITVFTRVLRHNIRNDMTVIRSWVDVLANRFENDPDDAQRIIDTVDNLVELSEKARIFESVVRSNDSREPVDITHMLDTVITEIETEYPSATISLERSRPLAISVTGSLQIAVRELVENAVKHAGDSPTITVSAERIYWKGQRGLNGVEIRIEDTGPGLPESEQRVLQEGVEDPLTHGSGLGLYMVYWIVQTHGGTIEASVSETGTTMVVSLPESDTIAEPDSDAIEQLFQRAQDRFKTVFEESSPGMVVFNDEGRIIEANPRAAALHGLQEEELVGRHLQEFIREFDFESDWPAFKASESTRETLVLVRPDGTERTIEVATTPDIVPGQHLAVLHDITERREREQELEWKTRALEEAPVGITIADATQDDNPLIYANDAFQELTGYDQSDILGRNCRVLQGEKTDPDARATIAEAIDAEEPVSVELRNYRKDGTEFWNHLTIAPVRDDAGDTTHFVGFQRDVTTRHERNRELAQLEEILETVLSHVPIVLWTTDEEGVITRSRGAGLAAFGFEPGEAVGESVFEICGDDEQISVLTERALRGDAVTDTITVGDGTADVWVHPLRSRTDTPDGTVGVAYTHRTGADTTQTSPARSE